MTARTHQTKRDVQKPRTARVIPVADPAGYFVNWVGPHGVRIEEPLVFKTKQEAHAWCAERSLRIVLGGGTS